MHPIADCYRGVSGAPPGYAVIGFVPYAGAARDVRYCQARGNHFRNAPHDRIRPGLKGYFRGCSRNAAYCAMVGKGRILGSTGAIGVYHSHPYRARSAGWQRTGYVQVAVPATKNLHIRGRAFPKQYLGRPSCHKTVAMNFNSDAACGRPCIRGKVGDFGSVAFNVHKCRGFSTAGVVGIDDGHIHNTGNMRRQCAGHIQVAVPATKNLHIRGRAFPEQNLGGSSRHKTAALNLNRDTPGGGPAVRGNIGDYRCCHSVSRCDKQCQKQPEIELAHT
ncbi:MAG: hypothetical protein BWY09_02164 [Candidatus Hydrogenedentes bacterium ADurb.Bin179]|nr:MAG: hypothetical protein BWY09_02164 [Candidatus Hydrogenedentes bacterium ADurb.Bin179]